MSGAKGSLDYREAGVDIDAADEAKARIKRLVESTFTAGARGRFGGFGGMFRMPPEAKRPVLVASAEASARRSRSPSKRAAMTRSVATW